MLLGNCTVLNKSPMRKFAGTTESAERSNFSTSGALRNRQLVDRSTTAGALYALPQGGYAGLAWMLPQKSGNLAGRAFAKVSQAGTAVGGITTDGAASMSFAVADAQAYPLDDTSPLRTGSTSMSFTVADAFGKLIASGSGAAIMAFTVADALLVASINGTGSSGFTVGATATLGATADITGSVGFTINVANAQAYPLNDASPLRTGTASFAISGTLVPYAIGRMSGSTIDTSILTVDTIAAGVLAAALTSPIAANIRRVNNYVVTGDGQPGTEWGP